MTFDGTARMSNDDNCGNNGDDDALPGRPRTRGDCVDGPRPCPWVGCSHHLAIRVTEYGTIKSTRGLGSLSPRKHAIPGDKRAEVVNDFCEAVAEDLMSMSMTCSLDVDDGMMAREAGASSGMTTIKSAIKEVADAERAYRSAWLKVYGEPPDIP